MRLLNENFWCCVAIGRDIVTIYYKYSYFQDVISNKYILDQKSKKKLLVVVISGF